MGCGSSAGSRVTSNTSEPGPLPTRPNLQSQITVEPVLLPIGHHDDQRDAAASSQSPSEPQGEQLEEELQAKFLELDIDGDGFLSRQDLHAALSPLGVRRNKIEQIFQTSDTGQKGAVDWDDFRRNYRAFSVQSCGTDNFDNNRRSPGTSPTSATPLSHFDSVSASRGCYTELTTLQMHLNSIDHDELANVIRPGSLGVVLVGATNVPKMAWLGGDSNPYVIIEVLDKSGTCVARERTFTAEKASNPIWMQPMSLPVQEPERASPSDVLVEHWELETTSLRFSMFDADMMFDHFIGECTLPLLEIIEHRHIRLLIWHKNGEAVLGSAPPSMPCELALCVVPASMPAEWRRSSFLSESPSPYYPCHIFMMTRGTRGDVQPFVALARGMAERLGWLVTICTELRWKSFVKSNANVSRGRIRFRPSGGDTEARMESRTAKWALQSKKELMQMTIMAASEVEFFSSATVFVSHVLACERESKPVDLVAFGLTVARVAALICELCNRPLVGFILQPSCIPSHDKEWTAVQPLGDAESSFTSHEALKKMKDRIESTRFMKYNLDYLRESFGLPVEDTWATLRGMDVPLVIPMTDGTFPRPSDWHEGICLTDFIFLRNSSKPGASTLGEPLGGFVSKARAENGKLCIMTFSSMPVARRLMLTSALKMVEECHFDLRLIYVGKKMDDKVSSSLSERAQNLTDAGRFLEVERADFGLLFKEMDCFVIHGGLGTTVEALRMQKPCMVTGPLLLDQRFWGSVCHQKGVGPEAVHIDSFEKVCAEFANGALDPADPFGWQARAKEHDWGDLADDGVRTNVQWFCQFMESRMPDDADEAGPAPIDIAEVQENPAQSEEPSQFDIDMAGKGKGKEGGKEGGKAKGEGRGKGKRGRWRGKGRRDRKGAQPRNDRNPFEVDAFEPGPFENGQRQEPNPFDPGRDRREPTRDQPTSSSSFSHRSRPTSEPPRSSSSHTPTAMQPPRQIMPGLDIGRLVAHRGGQ